MITFLVMRQELDCRRGKSNQLNGPIWGPSHCAAFIIFNFCN